MAIELMNLKRTFTRIGFDWDSDFKEQSIAITNDKKLSEKLKGNTYFYSKDKHTKTSFYLFDKEGLTKDEIQNIHLRVWNENKADLFIFPENDRLKINYSSTVPNKEITIIEIDINQDDEEILEKISKSHFDSGAFWLLYQDKLQKVKRQTVDQKLIETLIDLRKSLQKIYSYIPDEINRDYLIQSLIDRTLFIKFLEDKHIINSYFYDYLFGRQTNYKELLSLKSKKDINKLFKKINELFNNHLFSEPKIPEGELIDSALELLNDTISQTNINTGQLSLFDFQFDVIPIEFISHIYQIFLEKEKVQGGIHYTPEGLVRLIIDDTIGTSHGTVIDPACGSGIFLVLALRRMLKNFKVSSHDTYTLIKERNKFLQKNIFGIEIQPIAHRITYFSLYLELLYGIEPTKLKELIKDNVRDKNFKLFPYSFKDNILCTNTLRLKEHEQPFKVMTFDFVIGNPPWKQITSKYEEVQFWQIHKDKIGGKQLSQCFVIKAKDWIHEKTKLGLVLNSSNFYNETFSRFHNYFFNSFDIKIFYELSNLNIFLTAKEPTCVVIFTPSGKKDNIMKFVTPLENDFTKTFGVVLLNEDDVIKIRQKDLIENKLLIRDFFCGNQYDVNLARKLENKSLYKTLSDYLNNDASSIQNGLQIVSKDKVIKEYNISNWESLDQLEQKVYKEKFRLKYSRKEPNRVFNIPFIVTNNLNKYELSNVDCYLKDIFKSRISNKFERARSEDIYKGEKLLVNRVGNSLKAVYIEEEVYFSFDIYAIKLCDRELYKVVLAILNSKLIDYYLLIKKRIRLGGNYPKITKRILQNLPLPEVITDEDVKEIDDLTQRILSEHIESDLLEYKINEKIYKLYGLDLLERRRIDDFFIRDNERVTSEDIREYCRTFYKMFQYYLKNTINLKFEYYLSNKTSPIDFAGVKLSFVKKDSKYKNISINKVVKFITYNLISQVQNQNILSLKERIYCQDSIFLIKDTNRKSWSKTRAFEDAETELRKFENR